MLQKFIDENLIRTEDFIRIPTKEIYERYCKFCYHYNVGKIRRNLFYIELAKLGVVRDERARNFYVGWYVKACKY